jgi:hypothetical protein
VRDDGGACIGTGVFGLTGQNWDAVMGDRSTRALWGIGAKTACKLAECGLYTVRELAAADPAALAADLGRASAGGTSSWGAVSGLWRCAASRGCPAPAATRRPSPPTTEWAAVRAATAGLARRVAADVTAEGRPAAGWASLRFAPFTTRSRSTTLAQDLARPRAVDVDPRTGRTLSPADPPASSTGATACRQATTSAGRPANTRDHGAECNGEAPVADAGRSGHLECAGAEPSRVCDLGRYAAQSIDLLIEGSVIAIVPTVPRRSPPWIAGCARSFPRPSSPARPAGVWPGTRGGAADNTRPAGLCLTGC